MMSRACVNVVLCLLLAGVGQVPAPGVWPEAEPGEAPPSELADDNDRTGLEPSALIFLKAPSWPGDGILSV